MHLEDPLRMTRRKASIDQIDVSNVVLKRHKMYSTIKFQFFFTAFYGNPNIRVFFCIALAVAIQILEIILPICPYVFRAYEEN